MRLLLLVSALMLVGVATFEARNPRYYRWLERPDSQTAEVDLWTYGELGRQRIDTRLRPKPPRAQRPIGTVTMQEEATLATQVAQGEQLRSIDANTSKSTLHQGLMEIQQMQNDIALRAVKDNTLVSRPQEHDAWFRLFDRLQVSTVERLHEMTTGRVGFLQLFQQPENYRGKVVTIGGTARLAYHVRAPKNGYGITGYYVLVLRPIGGPNSPILVYSLETPTGFPPILDKDLDKKTTPLNEDLDVTGFFFKNCAYQARDGTRIAPLLLAKVPDWQRRSAQRSPADAPNLALLISSVLGTAVAAILVSRAVYLRHRAASPLLVHYGATKLRGQETLQWLQQESTSPTVGETLQQIAVQLTDQEAESPESNEGNDDA